MKKKKTPGSKRPGLPPFKGLYDAYDPRRRYSLERLSEYPDLYQELLELPRRHAATRKQFEGVRRELLESEKQREQGRGKKGKFGPLRIAIERICKRWQTYDFNGVLALIRISMGRDIRGIFRRDAISEWFLDRRGAKKNPLGIEFQEIDPEKKRIKYVIRPGGKEKEISYHGLDVILSRIRPKKL